MGDEYCKAPTRFGALCDKAFPGKTAQIRSIMNNVKPILDKFKDSAPAWEQDYATAFCKFSDFGATYSSVGKVWHSQL